MRSATSLPTTENYCCIFVSRESKSPCCKAGWGVQSPFRLSVSQPLCKKYKTLPLCCQATMTPLTSKHFRHLGFFFQIYSCQGQGDNNSYTLITSNYLFLPPPQLSASVYLLFGFLTTSSCPVHPAQQ